MKLSILGGIVAVLAVLLYMSAYIVPQTQFALPLRIGEPQQPRKQPGLYWKLPFVDSVVYFDNRILDLDTPSQEVIANDQKRLVVDAFGRYQITDPLKFYQTLTSINGAELRLTSIMSSALRRVLGQSSFLDVVRDNRSGLMTKIKDEVNREATGFGVIVIDVRIRRADLPDANSQAVFDRMKTDRQREAAQFRAQGSEQAQRIRAEADRNVARIRGEANGAANQTRGAADADRIRIFADAYNRDPDFFAFYRSMQAYTDTMKPSNTRFLIAPDSAFFNYLKDPNSTLPRLPPLASTPQAQTPAQAAPAPAQAPTPSGTPAPAQQ